MKTNRQNKTARNQKQAQGESGFTLIETSIPMVVMMIAGLAVSSLVVFSLQINVGGGERALAIDVAPQHLEQLRSVAYEDATLVVGETTATVRNGERGYTVVKTITDLTNDDDKSRQLKKITIVVTPTDGAPAWTRTPVTLVSLRSSL